MSQTKNFDPERFPMTFAGILIKGFAPGTIAKIVKNQPDWKSRSGPDGEFLRVKQGDKSGYVEFTLSQSSSSNDALNARRKLDLAGLKGTGVFSYTDLNGTSKGSAEGCFIETLPDQEWGDEAKDRVWRIVIPDCSKFDIGGNTAA